MALDALHDLRLEVRPWPAPVRPGPADPFGAGAARTLARLARGWAGEGAGPREALRAAHAAEVARRDAAAFDAGEAWEAEDDGAAWLEPLGD